MDRDALAALEERVRTVRDLANEKAVLARSLPKGEPFADAVLSTAILAFAVLAVFFVGLQIGLFVADGATCAALPADERATITYATDGYTVTLDTYGTVGKTVQGHFTSGRVSGADVRALVDRLLAGCFLERLPAYQYKGAGWHSVTLRVQHDVMTLHYEGELSGPIRMCGGHDDLTQIVAAIAKLAGQLD